MLADGTLPQKLGSPRMSPGDGQTRGWGFPCLISRVLEKAMQAQGHSSLGRVRVQVVGVICRS